MDGCGIGVLVLSGAVVVGLFVAGGFLIARERKKRFDVFCRWVADQLGGTCEPGAIFSPPVIRFRASGHPAVIRFSRGGEDNSGATDVEVDLHGRSPGMLKIFPEHFHDSILKFFGAQDVAVGDREFDALYVVKSNPESLAHHVFSPERRARVVACVRRLAGNAVFDLGRDRLMVRVHEFLEREASILNLAQAAVEFLGYLLETEAPGDIRWMESAGTAGGQCQVCGTEMKDRIVLCARCRTPHHEECWLYLGECSTFACKERRYVAGGRTFQTPGRKQTPDEWLRDEVDRDRREMARREAEGAVRRFERRQEGRRG